MQANSIAQAEVKVIDDLHKMKEWLDRAQDHANRQVGLGKHLMTITSSIQLNMFLCFLLSCKPVAGRFGPAVLVHSISTWKGMGGTICPVPPHVCCHYDWHSRWTCRTAEVSEPVESRWGHS